MANRLIVPSLADIRQDIAGAIPVELVKKWSKSDKSRTTHKKVLAPFTKKGTVISSDSSGLSKLTKSKSLLEVLQLISQPKEIIYNFGKAINGDAVGIWAADNTQMFFADTISPSDVLEQMVAAQQEIVHLSVQVGIGIHCGQFIHLGGGLFGKDADFVEEFAEEHVGGGEIMVTSRTKRKLKKHLHAFLSPVKNAFQKETVFNVDTKAIISHGKKSDDAYYPIPFTKDFYDAIRSTDDNALKAFKKYSSEKIVVLVKIKHRQSTLLLDTLTEWILSNTILKELTLLDGIEEVKSNGSLGIFVTDDIAQALQFAQDTRDTLNENGYTVSIGIAQGEILLFPLEDKSKEIAGGPVNMASKLAEDMGGENVIVVHDSLQVKKTSLSGTAFKTTISGVEIAGIKL